MALVPLYGGRAGWVKWLRPWDLPNNRLCLWGLVAQLAGTHITQCCGSCFCHEGWDYRAVSFPASWLHVRAHAHFQNTLFWGMRGLLVDMLYARIFSKIFWAFWGYERIALMHFLLVKNSSLCLFQEATNKTAVSPIACLFTSLLFTVFLLFSRKHCFHLPPVRKELSPSACSPFYQTHSSSSQKTLASHFSLNLFNTSCSTAWTVPIPFPGG